MLEKEVHFELECECGEVLKGYFSDTDNQERLFCNCGLVWEISKPYKEVK
jgi:hypothetical protein